MKNFKEQIEELKSKISQKEWEKIVASVKKFSKTLEDVDTVRSQKTDIVLKPTEEVKDIADKAIASKITKEEIKKIINDNIIKEFDE